jgi:hypothetical protein
MSHVPSDSSEIHSLPLHHKLHSSPKATYNVNNTTKINVALIEGLIRPTVLFRWSMQVSRSSNSTCTHPTQFAVDVCFSMALDVIFFFPKMISASI